MGEKEKKSVGRTTHLEFGGIPGAVAMVIGLPLGVFLINLACNPDACTIWPLPAIPSQLENYFDATAALVYLGWFVFQLALQVLPTGHLAEGLPLRTGERLKYRCNAFISLVITLLAFGVMVYLEYPVTYVYDKYLQLATMAFIFSFCLAVLLYAKALAAPNTALAAGGNSGNAVYDFFIGRELNPRIGPIDLKFFCELRPGLIGWVMLDLCFIAQSCKQHGQPSPALLLVSAFHAFYVADALWFEEAILTTMDIVHDGFGFMLAFGDLTWVPFLYSLQARFLMEHQQQWSATALLGIVALKVVGYTIFRGSNSQKNEFRKNPNSPAVAHLKTISTKSGRKLLVSGWWGLCRHPNYLGDLLMALAWSLPCDFNHILPYFYPIYFLGLLLHRFERDEVGCQSKYGPDWDVYKSHVKYKIFPYIY